MDNKPLQHRLKQLKFIVCFKFFFKVFLLLFSALASDIAAEIHTFEAESAESFGGASKVKSTAASEEYLISLTTAGQGIKFNNLPPSGKLAVYYASVETGTISIGISDQPERKLNIHSSGDLISSFLYVKIDVEIPEDATIIISLTVNDVPVNIDRIVVGDEEMGLAPDIWNMPPLPVADGPYSADWKSLNRIYTVPEWWRDAKFGAWAHWDPQSMPEMGDWYARRMYQESDTVYKFHCITFGHPSEYGYKDICHNWVIDRWNPDEVMDLYVEMGARYFMAMGVHHDNFDCWNSAYQPWNSVNVGPRQDIVGIWEKTARRHGLRFGIGFHNTPARTWGQFMPLRYSGDKNGPKKGV
ncbi:MAG TPA: alpha-L-fucosidase, partial [Ignavibacteriaceae bacterium]|nr:alpha-L-fucosidase [Ignavibacteriaceae bacterium]